MINIILPPKSAIRAVSNYMIPSTQSPSITKRDALNEMDASINLTTMVILMIWVIYGILDGTGSCYMWNPRRVTAIRHKTE